MPTLLQLMQKSGLNRNQVSKISGISNTYLTKIERYEADGAKIDIRRKTLINIAVSLNLNIVEINELLHDYNHSPVSTSDTPYFLAASENQNVTGILPLFSSLALEWFLIGLEKMISTTDGASLIYVLDQPSHSLKSGEHASYTHYMNSDAHEATAYKDLVATACLHRKKLITEALERGNVITTYICEDCLKRYLARWTKYRGSDIAATYQGYLREHIETLIHYIEKYPEQYRFRLLQKCPRIKYEMLYLPEKNDMGEIESKISKVFFHGQESSCNNNQLLLGNIQDFSFGQGFGDLIGFATDLQNLLEFFHKQHVGLVENFVNSETDSPKKIVKRLHEILNQDKKEKA